MEKYITMISELDWYAFLFALVVFALAIKGAVELWDWAKNRFGIQFKRDVEKKEEQKLIEKHEAEINTLTSTTEVILEKLDETLEAVNGLKDDYTKMNAKIDKFQEQLDANSDANVMAFCDRLEQKCRMYIETLHGIPENEYQSFCDMYDVYVNKLHGNHGVDKKFKYCIENLPIIPSTLFLVRTDNLISNKKDNNRVG